MVKIIIMNRMIAVTLDFFFIPTTLFCENLPVNIYSIYREIHGTQKIPMQNEKNPKKKPRRCDGT